MRLDETMLLLGAKHGEACDAAAAVRAFALFCPNTHYLQHVRRGSLSF